MDMSSNSWSLLGSSAVSVFRVTIPPGAFEEMAEASERIYTTPPKQDQWWNIYAGDDSYQYQLPSGAEDPGEIVTRKTDTALEPKSDQELLDISIPKDVERDPENQVVSRSQLNRLRKEMNPIIQDEPGAEVMTDSDWMDILEPTEAQKKRTKGKAQLGLAAGALDVFSQPTIAKGMKAASPHLTKLGETATAQEDAIDKAILQGKVLSKVYSDRASAKGKADIALQKYKDKQTTDPLDVYNSILDVAAAKDPRNLNKDQYLAAAFSRATRKKPIVLNGPKGGNEGMEKDKIAIEAAEEGDVFLLDGQYSIVESGRRENITVEELLKV